MRFRREAEETEMNQSGSKTELSFFPPRQSNCLHLSSHLPLATPTSSVPQSLHLVLMPVSPVAHSLVSPCLLRSPHLSSATLFCVFSDRALERSTLCLYISVCSVPDVLSKGSLFALLPPESCRWVHPDTPVTVRDRSVK
ncbi:hypothetical protein EYF80_061540 [Liparis tanakae]|uniref:Uncharacterized protein n=1 Tax=Liparis tanakae TaxID=230148 RepID=A0A4Z2EIC1_9TELE|nr:hypothetical protein EYF80_061540 [Liparis tanakae]